MSFKEFLKDAAYDIIAISLAVIGIVGMFISFGYLFSQKDEVVRIQVKDKMQLNDRSGSLYIIGTLPWGDGEVKVTPYEYSIAKIGSYSYVKMFTPKQAGERLPIIIFGFVFLVMMFASFGMALNRGYM